MPGKANKSTFVKQAAILAAAGILVRVLGFLYRLPLTNMIGNEGNGIYAIGYNVYNFFLIMSSAGLPVAISRMVAERITKGRPDEAHRVFKIAMLLSGTLGFAAMLIMFFRTEFILGFFEDSERSYQALVMLAPTVFIVSIMAVFRGYFQGLQSTVPTAISQLVEQVFNAVFSVLLAYLFMKNAAMLEGGDVIAQGAAGGTAGTGIGALAGLVFLIAFYYVVRPVIFKDINSVGREKKRQPAKSVMREILKIAIPVIAGTAVFSISSLIDSAMVTNRLLASGILDKAERLDLFGQLTGKYITITTLPVSISTSLATAAIPSVVASVVRKDRDAVNAKINTSMRIAMIISIPAAVGIGVLADQILLLLYPNTPDGGMLLKVGSASIIFLALTLIITGMLQGIGKVVIPVVGATCGALVKIPLNYFLIANPNIRIIGAVISTICCYVTASAIGWYFLSKYTKTRLDLSGILIKPLIAATGMGLACFVSYYTIYYIYPSNTICTLLSIAVSIVAYFVFLLLIRGLKRGDVLLFPMGEKMVAILEKYKLF